MKRFFSLFLTAALAGAGFVSCSDDPEDQPVVPTDVEKVSGIETNYVLGLHEYLEITPDIELSNENESISYEWSIDYETVSTERNLSFKCDELLNAVSADLHTNIDNCMREIETGISGMQYEVNTLMQKIESRNSEMSDRIDYYRNCVTDGITKKLSDMDEKYGIEHDKN